MTHRQHDTAAVQRIARVTARQVQYWCEQGFLYFRDVGAGKMFTPTQVLIACVLGNIRRRGLSEARAVARFLQRQRDLLGGRRYLVLNGRKPHIVEHADLLRFCLKARGVTVISLAEAAERLREAG